MKWTHETHHKWTARREAIVNIPHDPALLVGRHVCITQGRGGEVMAQRTTTAFRLPDDLYQRLSEAAQGYGLPMNFLVIKAIEDFLEHMIPPEEFRLTRHGQPTAQGVRAPGGGEALPNQGQSEGTP